MTLRPSSLVLAVAGLLFVGSPALPVIVVAQDIEFEEVGDIPLDAEDIDFSSDGALWALASRLYRLALGADIWEEVYDAAGGLGSHLITISPDTLLRGTNSGQHRSTNGGLDWESVYSDGPAQFAASVSGPNHGVILVGTFGSPAPGIAYSTDRGASFTESTFTVSTGSTPFMEDAVEILEGPAAGRLVAGVFGGIVISEDSGQTWEPSSLFQDARFWVQRVVIGTDPGTGNRRLYATLADAQQPDVQFYYSDDDGLTWTNVPGMVDAFLFVFVPQDDGYLLAVERATALEGDRLKLWRSQDSAQTWQEAGELPADVNGGGIFSKDMLIGPDIHVYVAVSRAGVQREWVYRTTEPVVVANEPEAPPPPTAERLVVYPNPATDWITVEANQNIGNVVLYDLLGRAVRRARLVTGIAVLDTPLLPAGVYVVRAGGEAILVTIQH